MKLVIKAAALGAALIGATLSAETPARADRFSMSFYGPSIGFSYESGGYCDRWGCPDDFWDYPVYYCPVFFADAWYRGPFYYRFWRGEYWFWLHGGWHRDGWYGPRPPGACEDRFGPALGYDFYVGHGFRWNDEWRERWWREHRGEFGDRDYDSWRERDRYGDRGARDDYYFNHRSQFNGQNGDSRRNFDQGNPGENWHGQDSGDRNFERSRGDDNAHSDRWNGQTNHFTQPALPNNPPPPPPSHASSNTQTSTPHTEHNDHASHDDRGDHGQPH